MFKIVFVVFILILPFTLRAKPLPDLIATIRSDAINTLFGTRIVPLGDQNNDGYDDFITWDFRFKAFLFYGGNPLDSLPALIFNSVNGNINNLGDVNGDSFSDFSMLGRSPFNWKLGLYYGGMSLDTIRDAWFGADSLFAVGFTASCEDINENGYKEIVSPSLDFSSVLLYELGTVQDSIHDLIIRPFSVTGSYVFAENIICGDFNSDGAPDLAISLRFPEIQQIRGSVNLYWGGVTFDTIPDMVISRPGAWFSGAHAFGNVLEYLGDFNGDGYDDFIAGSASSTFDSLHFIYFGGPSIDTVPDIVISPWLTKARLAGDLNGDGYNDLIVSYPLPFSGSGDVRVYYGGPGADSIPDIVVRNSDMPQYQLEFGIDCSGAGDVDGNGVDDFAFSAVENSIGTVYIFSGPGPSTGVEIEYEAAIPSDYKLSQNYPNPFNPSTTIEFSLPARNHVTLTVSNVTGQEVTTLINEQLSAGTYKVTWDGRDNDDYEVASGVYFYQLEAGDFVESKKMMLVK